ncbi:hypothetical protein CEXT_618591 [Caerostris extrusa]|uniref:Uncharacterized protein n=1 Tax=Caerostris extrusa TaxID=172846 RepID=A0AAV4PVV3_CAEEX|nr:hypothetical protein CEXT_618591 [Caerostris extrusa]
MTPRLESVKTHPANRRTKKKKNRLRKEQKGLLMGEGARETEMSCLVPDHFSPVKGQRVDICGDFRDKNKGEGDERVRDKEEEDKVALKRNGTKEDGRTLRRRRVEGGWRKREEEH